MMSVNNLKEYLLARNPYPCLNLLESAVVCSERNTGIPAPLFSDLAGLFGRETMETEMINLEEMEILTRSGDGISLNKEDLPSLIALLNQLKKSLKLTLASREQTAGIFLDRLVAYIGKEIPCLTVTEAADGVDYLIAWRGSRFRLQLALSPAWLPAVSDQAAKENCFIAVFGPFAAQNWQKMFRYCEYPAFRNYTAYYDPWHRQKTNISKGGLFPYFDWFFRDEFGSKFFIPAEFSGNLQRIGLLRYNDER